MASQRELSLLAHGVRFWNDRARTARSGRPDLTGGHFARARWTNIDLRGADLSGADLRGAKLRGANLSDAILDGANLSDATLAGVIATSASLKKATLHRTCATDASFNGAEFTDADLIETNFSRSDLTAAVFLRANLDKTNFTASCLRQAVFYYALLTETQFRDAAMAKAYFGGTTINDVNFSTAHGLTQTEHRVVSFVSLGALRQELTPEVLLFYKACGVNEIEARFGDIWRTDITDAELMTAVYRIAELRMSQPILRNPLFISYSHADRHFVDVLERALNEQGIKCWRDVKNMTVGPIDAQIDRAIRLNPTVLLILSAASVRSDWVAWEAATARRVEREFNRSVLCPITIDDEWRTCAWPGPLRQQIESYHLLDFSNWKDDATFRQQFARLREGLRLYYDRTN